MEEHRSLPTYETLLLEREGPILWLTLNRPERLNALNRQMHEDLLAVFNWIIAEDTSSAVVMTGAGRGFCSGGDVFGQVESPQGTNAERRPGQVHLLGRHIIDRMLWIEKPIVTMVNGPAAGIGATLALLGDVVVMAEEASVGDTHVRVGLVPGDGGVAIWPMLVGLNRAKELLMTGRMVSGSEAYGLGLANHVVPLSALRDKARGIASHFAELPAFAVRATKVVMNRTLRAEIDRLVDLSLALESLSMDMPEHKQASLAFVQQRRSRRERLAGSGS